MSKHKWHKEIKAWADGAEIEKWMLNDTWQRVGHPDWYEFENYRIKPQPKDWVGIAMHLITIGLLSWFIFGMLYLLSLLIGVM